MNWDTIIVAVIVAIPPTIVAVRTHKAVNSRMDELLRLAKEGSRAQATLDEKKAEAERQAKKGET